MIQEKMRNFIEKNNIYREDIAKACHVSLKLLDILENGGVTHPNLAKKIGPWYGLNELETEELMPENYRPHSPNYDPDKYKIEPNNWNNRLLPKKEEIDIYLKEKRYNEYY